MSRRLPINSPHGGEYISKEIIRKSKLDVKLNKTINEPLYTLVISLYKGGIQYHFSVARLVYYVFARKIDLKDRKIFITYKDGDPTGTRTLLNFKEFKLFMDIKYIFHETKNQ